MKAFNFACLYKVQVHSHFNHRRSDLLREKKKDGVHIFCEIHLYDRVSIVENDYWT